MSGFLLDAYVSGATIKALFHTFNAAGASVTVTNFVAGDVEIYKDGSVTQRSSDNGVTIDDDFDTNTGIHLVSIDLSDNTDAGFYAVGSQYSVMVGPITVDSQTVNFVLGSFRIMAAEHTAGYPVATIKDGTGTGEIDTTSGGVLVAAVASGAITAAAIADGAIDAATFAAGAITATVIATDAIDSDAIAANAVTEIQSGLATSAALASVASDVATTLAAVDTEVGAIKAKTDSLTFTVAGQVDANIQAVNDVAVSGSGAPGDEWGP